jgi:lysyl-tRNA synthetase class 2
MLRALKARADVLATLRAFFAARGVLEVETPLLSRSTVTDPALSPLACGERWLQTSPEYAMKRLLAAGSGPVFQVCKAFRSGEAGPRHNPEFTLLEWYRPGFSLRELIDEVAELVLQLLGDKPVEILSYRELFRRELDLDPHLAQPPELEACARQHLDYGGGAESRDTWLDLLLSHVLEPRLQGLVFVHDYPASQAALARLRRDGDVEVAERFELFVDGVELANGYRELTDPVEQRRRFEADNAVLAARGEAPRPLDEWLLAALESGLPECAGVALGLDRLLMAKLGVSDIGGVIPLDWSRC